MRIHKETEFDVNNYDEFYAHHHFVPIRPDKVTQMHRHVPRVAWALDVAKEVKPKKILDLGCLDGFALLTLVANIEGSEGVGVDLSEDGIMYANKNSKSYKLNAKFYVNKIERYLENTDDMFDLIVFFEVIEHVDNPQRVLKDIKKHLNPGGVLLITTPSYESPQFGKDDEQNKCHVRLYTVQDSNYTSKNKYGTEREATSMSKELGAAGFTIDTMGIFSELIHVRASCQTN